MRYKELIVVFFAGSFIALSNALGISSKLDFGDSSKLVGTMAQYRSHNKAVKREDKGDFEGIGVVCTSGGCNTTDSKDGSKGSVQTDVVVHVKTNVEFKSNDTKSTILDDTPDVPIVVGLAGTELDSVNRGFNSKSFVATDVGNSFSSTVAPPAWSSPFVPSAGPYRPLYTNTYTTPHPPYSSTYNPSTFRNVYVENPSFEPRVEIDFKGIPSVGLSRNDGQIDFKPMPSVLSANDGHNIKDYRYETNGLELRVPYFETSFHNHYFGEHPPPQFVWYPKRTSATNPVEFKNVHKSSWKPSLWYNTATYSPHAIQHDHNANCNCKNEPKTGLQWYPDRKTFRVDPGTQINDKLAPLN